MPALSQWEIKNLLVLHIYIPPPATFVEPSVYIYKTSLAHCNSHSYAYTVQHVHNVLTQPHNFWTWCHLSMTVIHADLSSIILNSAQSFEEDWQTGKSLNGPALLIRRNKFSVGLPLQLLTNVTTLCADRFMTSPPSTSSKWMTFSCTTSRR